MPQLKALQSCQVCVLCSVSYNAKDAAVCKRLDNQLARYLQFTVGAMLILGEEGIVALLLAAIASLASTASTRL